MTREIAQEIAKKTGFKLSMFADRVIAAINRKGGYCPCVPAKTEDTMCQCKDFREKQICHCNLFVDLNAGNEPTA